MVVGNGLVNHVTKWFSYWHDMKATEGYWMHVGWIRGEDNGGGSWSSISACHFLKWVAFPHLPTISFRHWSRWVWGHGHCSHDPAMGIAPMIQYRTNGACPPAPRGIPDAGDSGMAK